MTESEQPLNLPPLDNHHALMACANRDRKSLEQLHEMYMACPDLEMLGKLEARMECVRWRWFYCVGAVRMAAHIAGLEDD